MQYNLAASRTEGAVRIRKNQGLEAIETLPEAIFAVRNSGTWMIGLPDTRLASPVSGRVTEGTCGPDSAIGQ